MPADSPLHVRDGHSEERSAIDQPAVDQPNASWRDIYQVHPCADVFPMLSDVELDALAEDIRTNGLREPIVLWRVEDSSERSCILDGRNRMAALARLGVTFSPPGFDAEFPGGRTATVFRLCTTRDPAAYVISANIHRRHLTKEQQAELIVRTIEAGRNDSANLARSFSPIAGQRGGSSKDPVLQAAVDAGEKAGISKRTMQRAHAMGRGVKKRPRNKPTDGSATPAATSDASAPETSAPSTTAAAISKEIGAILLAIEGAIQRAVTRWPQGASRQPLIVSLHDQADRLAKGDEAPR